MDRGKGANTPTAIPLRGWWAIAKRVQTQIGEDHVSLVAAGMAFYGLLAIFPGIAACMALAGLVTQPATIVHQLQSYGQLLPKQAAEIIIGQATAVAGSRDGGLGLTAVVGLILTIYSASKGVASMIEGLNVAYDVDEARGFVAKTAVTLAFTVFLMIGLLLAIGATIVLPSILAVVPMLGAGPIVIAILPWPVLALAVVLGLSVIYRYGPARSAPAWRWVTPGAVIACLLWIAGSIGFAVYVQNFGSYNETFGSLGGVVILLMWLWLSSFIVLLGAEIDSEMERQVSIGATTVDQRPQGKRRLLGRDAAVDPDYSGA